MTDFNYSEVISSVQSIFELSARIDERVQNVISKTSNVENKIERQTLQLNDLYSKIQIMESRANDLAELKTTLKELNKELEDLHTRLINVENITSKQEGIWKTIFGFGIQLIWVVLAAYTLWRLGIQAPATP